MIISRAHKALVLPETGALRTLFPNSLQVGESLVLPHVTATVNKLKASGFDPPLPILHYYDWADGKPFTVQKSTCSLLTGNKRAYVLNSFGTGKTRAALWAWDFLNKEGSANKLLVVAPLSTLNFVWAREIFATLPERKCIVLHGSKSRRLELLAQDADIYIINHDGLKVIVNELHSREDIDTLCIDELAVYRNNSERSKLMRKFSQRFEWVWGMTGSPMPNEPTDVWAQAQIVTPATVPRYRTHCRDMLMTKINEFLWVPKEDATEKAFSMLRPAVRYTLDDVVELPPFVERMIDVELSPEQKKAYDKMVREYQILFQDKTINAANAAVAMQKLLQVSLGWVYDTEHNAVQFDSAPRVSALLELIESSSQKVIVFANYRHVVEGLSSILAKARIEHAVVHGDVNDRDPIFNLFQNTSKYRVLLAHPACMCHGITLTAADTVIWFGPTASLDTYEQANARIRRVGQKHKQQFLHLQGTLVEKRINSLLRSKQKVQDQFLRLFEDATREDN